MGIGLGERFRLLAVAFASQMEAAHGHVEVALNHSEATPGHATALSALVRQHQRNRREYLTYRLLDRPWLLPVSSLIDWINWLDGVIMAEGLARAGAAALQRLSITVTVDIPDETRRLLQAGSGALLVGDHPEFGGLDLLAVSSALSPFLSGDTLRFQGLFLLAGLGPGFAGHLFPVFIPSAAPDRIERRRQRFTGQGGPPSAAIKALMPPLSAPEAARRTRAAVEQLCAFWLTGGQVIVFPGGGGGAGAPWYPGIGRILLAATAHTAAHAAANHTATTDSASGGRQLAPALVFFHVRGASTWLFARPPLVAPYHPVRILAARHRPRLHVSLSVPLAVETVMPPASHRAVSRHGACALHLEATYRAWVRTISEGKFNRRLSNS